MAVLPPLYPNAGPTVINSGTWQDEIGSAISVGDGSHTNINMAPTAPGADVEFIKVDSGGIEYSLTDMPADLASLDSLTANIRLRTNGLINDTYTFSVVILDSGGTVIGSVTTIAATTTITNFTTFNVAIATLTDPTNKTRWDGAVIRLNAIRNANMGADGGSTGQISAVELTGTYTASGGTEYIDSGTAYVKLTPGTKRDIYTGDPALRGAYVFQGNEGFTGLLDSPLTRPYTIGVWAKAFPGEIMRTPMSVGEPPPVSGEGATIHVSSSGVVDAYEEKIPDTASDGGATTVTNWFCAAGVFRSNSNRELYLDGALSGTPSLTSLTTPLPDPTHLFIGHFPDESWKCTGYVGYVFVWDYELTEAQLQRWETGELVADAGYPYVFDLTRQAIIPDEHTDIVRGMMVFQTTTLGVPVFSTGSPPPVDYRIFIDAAFVNLKLTPSGVEDYTPGGGGGTLYTDSATARVTLTPSATESRERVDAATAYVDLTPSGTEARELADTGTVYVDLSASATEQREVADTATVGVALTPSAAELQEAVDADTALVTLTPSGTDEHVLPSTGALQLVIATVGTPTSGDAQVKTWLEEIGYTVTYVDDGTSENVTGFDGVVIGESVASGTIAAKYANVAVPVVTHEALNPDDLGLCTSALNPTSTFSQFQIQAPTHPIADGPYGTFSGDVTAYTTGVRGGTTFGYASGVTVVADRVGTTNEGNILAAEAGATLTIGPAPARRVFFALNDAAVPFLNANGIALLKNAYTWAFGTPGPVEHLDSATVTLTLTPSATEERESGDTDTAYLTLTASGVEQRELADATTAVLTLTPSAVEARELADAATVYLDLTASGTEARELADANTAYVDLTPSGTEQRELVDAATAYVDLTSAAVELWEAVDAATARVTLTPSAVEFYAPAKTTGVDEVEFEEPEQNPDTGLTTVYMRARANSGTGIIRLIAYQDGVELDREDFTLTLSIQEFSFDVAGVTDYEPLTVSFEGINQDGGELEAYIADIWLAVPSGVVTHYEDSNTVYVKLTPSADEVYTPPEGQEYLDSATARVTLTPSATEAKEVTDAQTVRLTLTASATESRELQDQATARVSLTPSSTEAREITDAATVTLSLTASGSDVLVAADASTTTVRLTPSGTDELTAGGVFTDAATAYVDLTPSGIDLRERVDTAEVYVDLTPSAVEVRERADAATVYVDLTASATEAREITDAATVPLALTPSSLETYERVDAATAYLDLTPSGTDQLVTEGVDVGTAYVDLTPSSIDIIAALETGVAYLDISVGGTDEPVFVDSGTAYVDILPSGTEETTTEYFDAATAYVSLLPSAEDVLATVGVYAVPLTLTPSAVELIEFGDTGTVYLDLAPGAGYMFDNPLLTLNLSRRYTGVLASRHFAGALASRRFGASLTARQFSGSLRSRHVEAQLLARKYNASLTR